MSGHLRYTIKARDGRVYSGRLGTDIRKTLDRRGDWEQPQVVYEARSDRGVIVRLWPEDVADVTVEVER